jgi:hypothetical protein
MVSQAFFVGAALSGRPIEKPPPDKRGFRSTELTTKSNLEPTHLTYEHVIPKHRCPLEQMGKAESLLRLIKYGLLPKPAVCPSTGSGRTVVC